MSSQVSQLDLSPWDCAARSVSWSPHCVRLLHALLEKAAFVDLVMSKVVLSCTPAHATCCARGLRSVCCGSGLYRICEVDNNQKLVMPDPSRFCGGPVMMPLQSFALPWLRPIAWIILSISISHVLTPLKPSSALHLPPSTRSNSSSSQPSSHSTSPISSTFPNPSSGYRRNQADSSAVSLGSRASVSQCCSHYHPSSWARYHYCWYLSRRWYWNEVCCSGPKQPRHPWKVSSAVKRWRMWESPV